MTVAPAPVSAADLASALDASPMARFAGVRLVEAAPEDRRLVLEMPFRPELARIEGGPQFHGGAVATLADLAACFAVVMMVAAPAPTIDLRLDYMRPAVSGPLRATAVVRRIGRTLSIADVEIVDADGRAVALARGAFAAVADRSAV